MEGKHPYDGENDGDDFYQHDDDNDDDSDLPIRAYFPAQLQNVTDMADIYA